MVSLISPRKNYESDTKSCSFCGADSVDKSPSGLIYYCTSCGKSVGYISTCVVCNKDYHLEDGTYLSTCSKSCRDKEGLNNYQTWHKINSVQEVDKDILTSEEMKLYADTKQVWWIRVIKWILKYI